MLFLELTKISPVVKSRATNLLRRHMQRPATTGRHDRRRSSSCSAGLSLFANRDYQVIHGVKSNGSVASIWLKIGPVDVPVVELPADPVDDAVNCVAVTPVIE